MGQKRQSACRFPTAVLPRECRTIKVRIILMSRSRQRRQKQGTRTVEWLVGWRTTPVGTRSRRSLPSTTRSKQRLFAADSWSLVASSAMTRSLQTLVLFLVTAGTSLLGACGDDEFEGIRPSDPAVLATFEPWERACVQWLRNDCYKAESCEIEPAPDCSKEDTELRLACQDMIDSCVAPDPQSFVECRERTAAESCQEYCDGGFCFNFCFFNCLE